MKLGLFAINMGICSDPESAAEVARTAEQAGFESVWTAEHVVLPDPHEPPSPLPPATPLLDPAVSLTFIAAHTSKIRLGTGIIILPQRNPLVLAKELASVDVLSKGRLIFGVGIGYLEPEFRALNVPFDDKGPRTVEYLEAMKAVWSSEQPAYDGRYFSYAGIQSYPRPVQLPHPPIVMGGLTKPAFRRAVMHANGWYGFMLGHDETEGCLDGLVTVASRVSRPLELGRLEISVTPAGEVSLESAKRYSELGVDRLILFSNEQSLDGLLGFVREAGDRLVGKL